MCNCKDCKDNNEFRLDCNQFVITNEGNPIYIPFDYKTNYSAYKQETFNVYTNHRVTVKNGFVLIKSSDKVLLEFNSLHDLDLTSIDNIHEYTKDSYPSNYASVTITLNSNLVDNDYFKLEGDTIIGGIHFNIGIDILSTLNNINTYINTLNNYTSIIENNSVIVTYIGTKTPVSNTVQVKYSGVSDVVLSSDTFITNTPQHTKKTYIDSIYIKDGLHNTDITITNISEEEYVTIYLLNIER